MKAIETAQTLFTADSSTSVSNPGGIAANMRYIFWTNKIAGTSKGVVIRVDNTAGSKRGVPKVLANNVDLAYGVCVNQNHVFFTGKSTNVYVVDQSGGPVGTATSSLVAPRGCTWDGDGTVYVADKQGNAVMSFPAGHTLAPVNAEKLVDVEGPFDVVMFVASGATTKNVMMLILLSVA